MEKSFWKTERGFTPDGVFRQHYSILSIKNRDIGMEALQTLFPIAEADSMNFVLFSTDGVHGSNVTIEECEENNLKPENQDNEDYYQLTFLVVHPRLVQLKYGTCVPTTPEDFAFLKKLRESSYRAVKQIGRGE